MHHNPVPTYLPPLDQITLQDSACSGEIIARHRDKVGHIFFGHCHLPLAGSFHGVPVSSGRGTTHAAQANFGETALLSGSDMPKAYSVMLANHTTVTVLMVEFGCSGDVRVEVSPDYAT